MPDRLPDGDAPRADESELIRRLRERAEELRGPVEKRPAEEPVEEPAVEEPETVAADPWADRPEDADDILSRWAGEEHIETESPDRNWSPLILVGVVVVAVGILYALFLFATGDTEDDASTGGAGDDAQAPSVTDVDPPSLEDLTAEVTVPPGPAEGLSVVDSGVTVVEDRFDPERREGTYAAIVQNPHEEWLAQGVQVDVSFIDEAGQVAGTDQAFLDVVLPGQRVAVGSLFFDAPTVPVVGVDVVLDVARWRESRPFDGELTTAEVETAEAEFSGVRTGFLLRSSFDEPLIDVGVTAVCRYKFGLIVGGSETFVDLVEPGVDTPAEITLLANVDVESIVATELYPSIGLGFVPDDE